MFDLDSLYDLYDLYDEALPGGLGVSPALKMASGGVVQGDITRYPAHLIGGGLNTLSLVPAITKDLSPYRSGDISAAERLLEGMVKEHPDALKDTRVIQGGGMRLGGTLKRHFTNKRTGPLGKILGLPITVSAALAGGLGRQPLYSPFTDEIYQPWDNPGVMSHEIGHAVDFNRGGADDKASFLAKQKAKLKRDIYTFACVLPGITSLQEYRAWEYAYNGIKKLREQGTLPPEEMAKLIETASQVRAPALTSYVIDEVGRYVPYGGAAGHAAAVGLGLTSAGKRSNKARLLGEKDKKKKDDE